MSLNTQLTPAEVRAAAQKHDDVGQTITSLQSSLDGQISSLVAGNSGAMIMTLQNVHSNWDAGVRDIVKNLSQMAADMRTTANQLEQQDATAGQNLAKVGAGTGNTTPLGGYLGG